MTANLIYHALTDPESLVRRNNLPTFGLPPYRLAYAYYTRKVFTNSGWSDYLATHELYKHTRLIFNPVPQVVDFYVDNIWRRADNVAYPKLITPALADTDSKLLLAIAQLDQWTNFWQEQEKIKQWCASTGACLVEAIDDTNSQKITQNTVWRGFIKGIEVNAAGDVQAYTVEYDAYDEDSKVWYKFKKIADKEVFRYFRDDKPFDYVGKTAVMPNPYGFCPAVLFTHSSGDDGAFTDFAKVNHANSLASHLHDNIHKEIESGKIVFSDEPSSVEVLSGASKDKNGVIVENDPRLERVILAMKGNGSIGDLSGLVKLADAEPYLKELLLSFADDYPELEYRQIIKTNCQLSGRALERLLTPAQNRLDRAAPNYDGQLIKLRQMQIAMGGMRVRDGWNARTRQQSVFAPFDLQSYELGRLDFNLKRSILIEPNEEEVVDLQTKKITNATTLAELIKSPNIWLKSLDFIDESERGEIIGVLEERRAEA